MEDLNLSTKDVPGFKPEHRDELALGCWAEHQDGSMIFVESVEDGRVVYSMFDLAETEIVEYRDSMSEMGFKKSFSWTAETDDFAPRKRDDRGRFAKDGDDDDDNKFATPWTWHDKTPFPWDVVIELGGKDGRKFAHADHLESAAERVARSRNLHRRRFNYDGALARAGSAGKAIVDKIQRAVGELRR